MPVWCFSFVPKPAKRICNISRSYKSIKESFLYGDVRVSEMHFDPQRRFSSGLAMGGEPWLRDVAETVLHRPVDPKWGRRKNIHVFFPSRKKLWVPSWLFFCAMLGWWWVRGGNLIHRPYFAPPRRILTIHVFLLHYPSHFSQALLRRWSVLLLLLQAPPRLRCLQERGGES